MFWLFLGAACFLFSFALGMFFACFMALMINGSIHYFKMARRLSAQVPPFAVKAVRHDLLE